MFLLQSGKTTERGNQARKSNNMRLDILAQRGQPRYIVGEPDDLRPSLGLSKAE